MRSDRQVQDIRGMMAALLAGSPSRECTGAVGGGRFNVACRSRSYPSFGILQGPAANIARQLDAAAAIRKRYPSVRLAPMFDIRTGQQLVSQLEFADGMVAIRRTPGVYRCHDAPHTRGHAHAPYPRGNASSANPYACIDMRNTPLALRRMQYTTRALAEATLIQACAG